MKILCTICARGGSVGVKNKNIREMHGKPLIAYTIQQAKKAGLFELVSVSSDSSEIQQIAKAWGANHIVERPEEMATATAPKVPAIRHAVLQTEAAHQTTYDYIVDLDATSPLRSVDDILQAFKMFIEHKEADNLVTACPARRSPYFNMLEVDAAGFAKLSKKPDSAVVRRQDSPACYDMNGSIYIWKREALLNVDMAISDKTLLYVMPEERSVDIDSSLDWEIVSLLAQSRKDLIGELSS